MTFLLEAAPIINLAIMQVSAEADGVVMSNEDKPIMQSALQCRSPVASLDQASEVRGGMRRSNQEKVAHCSETPYMAWLHAALTSSLPLPTHLQDFIAEFTSYLLLSASQMAPNKHTRPLSNEGMLSPASASNTISASSDKPTRLENALKAFRDVLTDDEREMLRTEMDVPRDASQVIAFTAGLDLVDPTRRGKSIATRLHSILQTVQQFSRVVDTYVSSHPELAALVWGSVRLAFTVCFSR